MGGARLGERGGAHLPQAAGEGAAAISPQAVRAGVLTGGSVLGAEGAPQAGRGGVYSLQAGGGRASISPQAGGVTGGSVLGAAGGSHPPQAVWGGCEPPAVRGGGEPPGQSGGVHIPPSQWGGGLLFLLRREMLGGDWMSVLCA